MALDIRQRNHQSELMDDPALDDAIHRQALSGLGRINWWSRTDFVVWSKIRRVIDRIGADATRPLTILDLASGGGDLAVRLARRARREGRSLLIDGCDISHTATDFAAASATAAGLTNVRFIQSDVLEHPFPRARYDIVMCSLFLHHLSSEQAVRLLERMKHCADCLVLVDDLNRTRFGYWLAWLGCRLLTRCHIVHADGPMSVEGAFSASEALSLAAKAGLTGATLSHHWPQRFLLSWIPERQNGGS